MGSCLKNCVCPWPFHKESRGLYKMRGEEQRCQDRVFFFLLHCFNNSHRLVSGNPVIESGSLVTLWPSFYNAKREKLGEVVCKGEPQKQDVISIESNGNRYEM